MPIDLLALMVAAAVAYYMRISPYVQSVRPAVFNLDLPFPEYMQLASIVALLVVGIFAFQGLYIIRATRRAFDEVTRIFSGISIGFMLIIVYVFLRAELFQSRFVLLSAYALSVVLVSLARYVVRRVQQAMLRRGMGVHRVVLAGNGKFAVELSNVFRLRPELGYRVVGKVVPIRLETLERVYRRRGIDEVIQTDPTLPEEDNMILLDFCEQYKIEYQYIPNMFEAHAVNVRYRQVGAIPLLQLLRTPLDGWGRIAKRVIDFFGSLLGLIILSPFFAIVALFIIFESRGSVFYRQVRVGRNMKPFEIFKFRSMYMKDCVGKDYGGAKAEKKYKELIGRANERKGGPLFKMRDDPRITSVGKFIRSWRIDELPQLINVLKGEMSMFGPRPHLPEEIEEYDKYHRRLFTIKPGMSGMAQVSGNAGLAFEEEVKLDISYIENWSLWLDFMLLLKTFRILFFDKNAV